MREDDLARVRALPMFATAAEATFAELVKTAHCQCFPAGSILLMEGDSVDFIHVLLQGTVELQGAWRDRESTLAVIGSGSTFVLAAAMLETRSQLSARTLERSKIMMLPAAALRRAMKSDGAFCFGVAEELSGCYGGLVRVIKSLKLRSGVERLANYLLTQRARQGGGRELTLPFCKRLLASTLGMTPEYLSRALASLGAYGVTLNGLRVSINRPGALERLAQPSPLIDNHTPASETPVGKAQIETWLGRISDAQFEPF
jgi:CRP/FNR family transcriptional activator FtrB